METQQHADPNDLGASRDSVNGTHSGLRTGARDPRRAALEAVLESRQFAKSPRLSSFLLYIVEAALDGREDEITEQQIGLHVFKRPAEFNSAEDNIVRTTARQLRQRLALYYQEDGSSDEVKIDVPRGGYIPDFQTRPETAPEQLSPALTPPGDGPLPSVGNGGTPQNANVAEHVQPAASARWSLYLAGVICFVAGVCLTVPVQHWLSNRRAQSYVSHALWSALFTNNRSTVFVPGDAGLTMYDNLARTQVRMADYMTGAYLREPAAQTPPGYRWTPFAERRYVSIVDLRFADHLRTLPEFRPEHYSIAYARDLHVTDFRNCNLILAGGPIHNPWIEAFDKDLNFHLTYDGATNVVRVLNASPLQGESATYTWSPDNPNRGYAYIAFVNNLHNDGKVLLIEGTTMGAVDAGETFLLSDPRMAEILQPATTGGKDLKNFELLLESNVIDGISLHSTIIARRFSSPA